MNLLAIETSTDACSVGLSVDGELLLDHRIAAQQHGVLVLPMVDALMNRAGMAPAQIDGVIFGRGPGSFTGVRIGVAVTQGIALGADAGVHGVSTLQSLAQGCYRVHGETHVAVSLDARMDEVYFAAFACDDEGVMQPVIDEMLVAPGQVPDLPTGSDWCWAGSGAERYREQVLASALDARIHADCWPMAQDLLRLGLAAVSTSALLPAEQAAPVYLRDKVAQTTAERAALARCD
ncbi:tRNA (adenosine(37)-N6)-threonylcarbamoyltransferase complex dimerization subunit type 1 TsaB [Granulosicoccus sp. 3-233]|uniref:tRNA (adenosine(37)-N6)-threonylcarbamoyltransferase complex dimerization subunit type 1 TsaB n=1 Tax=Granulosicoccus sp. 3-233 TaxID=3417969 RepID=UPI003D33B2B6